MQVRGTLEKGSLQLADENGRLIMDIAFELFTVGFQRRADSATVRPLHRLCVALFRMSSVPAVLLLV